MLLAASLLMTCDKDTPPILFFYFVRTNSINHSFYSACANKLVVLAS